MTDGVALALSGGGARGFAHIPVCEAFDACGVRPARIAGTSMGAVIGALYASGMEGAAIRSAILAAFAKRSEVMGRLMRARRGRGPLFALSFSKAGALDPKVLLEAFLPEDLPPLIEDLAMPFAAVAVDFATGEEAVFTSGPLIEALAASIAFPPVMRPVVSGGRVLIDGGVANPLPNDVAGLGGDRVIASDVVLLPRIGAGVIPSPLMDMVGSSQILMQAVARAKAALNPPALMVRPDVNHLTMFDFFKTPEIIAAGDGVRGTVEDWLRANA